MNIKGGDNRFYNNILIGADPVSAGQGKPASRDPEWGGGFGLWVYDFREFPLQTGGNVFYNGAQPYGKETSVVVVAAGDPQVKLVPEGEQFILHLILGPELKQAATKLVTTALLGKARIPGLPYEKPDGAPLKISTDYFGKKRSETNPSAGPFENPAPGQLALRVW